MTILGKLEGQLSEFQNQVNGRFDRISAILAEHQTGLVRLETATQALPVVNTQLDAIREALINQQRAPTVSNSVSRTLRDTSVVDGLGTIRQAIVRNFGLLIALDASVKQEVEAAAVGRQQQLTDLTLVEPAPLLGEVPDNHGPPAVNVIDAVPADAPVAMRGPNLAIPPFSGDQGEDFQSWRQNEFEMKFLANGWPDQNKPFLLGVHLNGRAKFAYNTLSNDDKQNYQQLVAGLESALMMEDRKRFLSDQYDIRVQKADESVYNYAQALTELAQSALGYMTVEAERQTNLRNKFIGGLRPHIREEVKVMGPTNSQNRFSPPNGLKQC